MSRVAVTLLILAALILGCGLALMGAAADPTTINPQQQQRWPMGRMSDVVGVRGEATPVPFREHPWAAIAEFIWVLKPEGSR